MFMCIMIYISARLDSHSIVKQLSFSCAVQVSQGQHNVKSYLALTLRSRCSLKPISMPETNGVRSYLKADFMESVASVTRVLLALTVVARKSRSAFKAPHTHVRRIGWRRQGENGGTSEKSGDSSHCDRILTDEWI